MGRKIPAKKHRGVKDPLVQQAKRLASLKGKINAPPKDPDEQPVPKSLMRLFAFRDPDKRKSITNKKHHSAGRQLQDNNANGAASNPLSSLRKLPGESGRGFSLRINSAVKALHNPAEELHYPLDIEAEDEKGLRMQEQRERRARKRRRAAQAERSGGGAAQAERSGGGAAQAERSGGGAAQAERSGGGAALTRTQKLALKKKAKKLKASEAHSERREVQYERVSFGDVTHAPPALHFKLGSAAARPGKRELLLSSMLAGAGAGAGGGGAAAPAAELQRRERARQAAVAAYRALKAAKLKNK